MISKAVLITGCSTGIGRATAERSGAQWTHGLRDGAAARSRSPISRSTAASCWRSTCATRRRCRQRSHAVEREHGAVGVLINNAGYGSEGPAEEVPMSEVRRQFETNVFGLLRLTQLVLPGMRRQRWGKIVNLSSMGGRMTLPGGGIYHATKYAVEALSDALRFEVRGFGVDVIVIEPGAIKTEFGNTAIARVDALGGSPDYAAFRDVLKQQIRDAYEGPMGGLRRRTGGGRQGDRESDHRAPAAHALRHHDGRAHADRAAPLGCPTAPSTPSCARSSSRRARRAGLEPVERGDSVAAGFASSLAPPPGRRRSAALQRSVDRATRLNYQPHR